MNLSTSSSDNSAPQARRYLQWVLACTGLPLLLLALFNRLINPLMMFDGPEIDGVNRYKTQLFFVQHLVKPYWAREQNYSSVILGSSRAGGGMNPGDLGSPVSNEAPAFNYAIPGARIATLAMTYDDIRQDPGLDRVIVTLDFFGFNKAPNATDIRDAELRRRLRGGEPGPGDRLAEVLLRDRLTSLFSWQSLRSSYATIEGQQAVELGRAGYFEFSRDGYWQQTISPQRSQRDLFRAIERQYMSTGWFPEPTRLFTFEYEGESSFSDYENLLRQLHADRVEVFLLVSPLHGRFLAAIETAGLWDEFERWKRELVNINFAVADSFSAEPFAIWDFAYALGPNTEPIPAAGDVESRMQFFVDGQHFRSTLGAQIFQRLMTEDAGTPGYGQRLAPGTLESHLARAVEQQREYARENPQEMDDLARSWDAINN